ncbi:class F sortase [Streptomyces sp. ID05-04B]|uniref:class F sortase n=1 Tax=unclassified Streptomyces TaxID=2593676 RepID=UPI0020B137A3|nr:MULTISPECIES: class F sortase [unclassified Streptomyces]MDX5569947.1 class F sortase [Streptomyces sp. ID05-04B]
MLCATAAVFIAISLCGGNEPSSGAGRPPHAPPAASGPATRADAPPAPSSSNARGEAPSGRHLRRSRPVRLLIPKISVDAPFTDLAIGRSGRLDPPPADDVNLVGWHAKGASPGEAGTAIIAGHVDTRTSPAVFAALSSLTEGDVFQVRRADGSKPSFRVDSVETFEKADFPDERVYGDTPEAQVRLITCAGAYDRRAKDYTDNLVVFAHLL